MQAILIVGRRSMPLSGRAASWAVLCAVRMAEINYARTCRGTLHGGEKSSKMDLETYGIGVPTVDDEEFVSAVESGKVNVVGQER